MMNGKTPPRVVLDKPRARRDACKVLAVALQVRYRVFLDTVGDQETNMIATADLAQCMYENIEFIIWALKAQGGMNPPPPEVLHKVTARQSANDPRFAKPLSPDRPPVLPTECTCPPLEHGIIGRDKHMTSCPKYIP